MTRLQKIRGLKRKLKKIEEWRLENLNLRFNLLEKYEMEHVEIIVHPWCDISIINSKYPEPKGKIKLKMLNGLIDIYEAWKNQLDKYGQPYYLKIWLYEQRFSKSQVICAIRDNISYYESIFYNPNKIKNLNFEHFGVAQRRLHNFQWDFYLDEDHYDNNYIGNPEDYSKHSVYEDSKNWFIKNLKKPHRTTKVDDKTELYSFNKGNLWVGELK